MSRVAPPPPKPVRRPPGRPPAGAGRGRDAGTLGEPRSVHDRPNGWKLAVRRHRRRLRPALYAAAVLGLLVVVGFGVHATSRAATLTPMRARLGAVGAALGLRVRTVVVQGRATTPEPLLAAAIGVAPGDALLGYSVAQARMRIDTLASVQDATVERRWPGTILVRLTERHSVAIWQNAGRFTLIDRDGAVLADQDPRRQPDLPLLVGVGAPAHAAVLLDLLAAHPVVRDHMVAAVRVSDRRWNLRMTSGADVLLPQDGQDRALARLDAMQASHQLLDRRLQVVDLRLADRITLRPAAPLPALTPAAGSPPAPTPGAAPAAMRQPAAADAAAAPRASRQPT